MNKLNQSSGENRGEILIDRHTIDSIKTYEITEEQLSMIESGASSNDLNFSIALNSVFVSFIVTLLITDIQGVAKLVFFWVATLVSGILGLYFALQYRAKKGNTVSIFQKIRDQKSTRVVRDNVAAEIPVTEIDEEQSRDEGTAIS